MELGLEPTTPGSNLWVPALLPGLFGSYWFHLSMGRWGSPCGPSPEAMTWQPHPLSGNPSSCLAWKPSHSLLFCQFGFNRSHDSWPEPCIICCPVFSFKYAYIEPQFPSSLLRFISQYSALQSALCILNGIQKHKKKHYFGAFSWQLCLKTLKHQTKGVSVVSGTLFEHRTRSTGKAEYVQEDIGTRVWTPTF